MASLNAPDTENLRIGKGILSFKKSGSSEFRDLGEVPQAELTLTINLLEYFTSRTGTRSKVKTAVLERSGSIRFVMNSITPDNLSLFFMGSTPADDNLGRPTFDILDVDVIAGQMMFHGTNAVGPRYDVMLYNVEIRPSGSINMIDDNDWSGVECTAEILYSSGDNSFGKVTVTNLDTDT